MSLAKIKEKRTKTARPMQMDRKPLKPLFPWVGGKRKEISHFEPLFPKYTTYSEPFVGAGAVYWHERPEKAVINDYLPDVTQHFKVVKKGELNNINNNLERKRKEGLTRKQYENVKNSKPTTDVGKATKFVYMKKMSFGGMTRYNKDGNITGSYNEGKNKLKTMNSIQKGHTAEEYEETLKNTKIITGDFEKAARAADSPTTFHFFDPPYDSPYSNYTGAGFTKSDHERLAKVFYSLKGKAMITVNDTPFIRSLYRKQDIKKVYKANLMTGDFKKKKKNQANEDSSYL